MEYEIKNKTVSEILNKHITTHELLRHKYKYKHIDKESKFKLIEMESDKIDALRDLKLDFIINLKGFATEEMNRIKLIKEDL